MISGLALLGFVAAVVQGEPPTVGDTIWVVRTIAVPGGRTLRTTDWAPADPVELLAPPRVTLHGDSAEIAYPIVVWRAGPHVVELPGPLLLGENGRVDSLPPQPLTLRIQSVLPPVPPDASIPPQPRADFVPRREVSILPLLVLWGGAVLLLAPLHWWWRRRGRVRPVPPSAPVAGGPPLERWADAGESRAVAAVATAKLRGSIAVQVPAAGTGLDTEEVLVQVASICPSWPLGELADLLRSLDEARFGDLAFPDAIGLARWVDELVPRLESAAP